MTTPVDDDPPRDAWLGEALRHAPDAEARPAPAVRAAILREAREVVRPRPAGFWPRAWALLGQPRFAGAFASLVVMVGAGALWWGRPLQEALPERAPAMVAEAPPASVTPDARRAPAATPEQRAAKAEQRTPTAPRRERAARVEPPLAPPPAVARQLDAAVAPAPSEAPPLQSLSRSAAPQAMRAQAAGTREQMLAGLAGLRARIAADPSAWTWVRDVEPPWPPDADPRQPVGPSMDAWLSALAAVVAAPEPGSRAPEAAPHSLYLIHRGDTPERFRVEADRVVWSRGLGTPASPAQLAALREALARLTP